MTARGMTDRAKAATLPVAIAVLLTALSLGASGCVLVERVEREDRTDRVDVALEGADEARVDIRMGAGQLIVGNRTVSGGDLMDAEFEYSVESWEPVVDYEVRDDEGRLEIRQPSGNVGPWGDTRYTWDIGLSEDVPLYIDVDMGAGESDFELGDLDLREFKLSLGAGDAAVDLVGDYPEDVDVSIEGGAGSITIRLPQALGVRVDVDQGIGQVHANGFRLDGGRYVNDAYEDADVFIDVNVTSGVGEITLLLED